MAFKVAGDSCRPGNGTVPSRHHIVEFEVPSSSVGLIIGKGGKQVKKIEEEAQLERFSISVSHNETEGMQMVTIKGQQFKCEAAKRKIEELVELSMKRKQHRDCSEVGQSAGARRKDKYLSFITFLEDSDEIEFKHYEGVPPSNWKSPRSYDLYFLEACQQETIVSPLESHAPEDLHRRLRNYRKLQESLHAEMEACFRSHPTFLRLEARFGKVLWKSDSQNCISDEVLRGRYKIKDLEKGGKVSVEDVLGRRNTKWEFRTILSDTTIPECVKANQFPVIGGAYRIDITMSYSRDSVHQEYYLVRIKQTEKNFELLEVHLKGDNRTYTFDCLNLERDLDMRIGITCPTQDAKPEAAAEMAMIAEELCHRMTSRDGCLYVKEPPGCSIEYARRGEYTMYLVSHHDKVHGECPYVLAHYHQVEDCWDAQRPRSAASTEVKRDRGGAEVKLQFMDGHHEVELWNCQWMADFAVLVGKTPEEAFARKFCDFSKIKIRPKDKSEVNAASVIRELDPFVACALQLALIDRD